LSGRRGCSNTPGAQTTESFDLSRIRAPAPHDLRRTWIRDLLDLGVDLATVQKVAGHASASTTAGYDRKDRGVQRRATLLLEMPYTTPED
jgi:integrase